MLQYALNDAKSVIYIFYMIVGIFLHLTEDFNEEMLKILSNKFLEGLENKSKIIPCEFNLIFTEITMRCNEIIKTKLKEKWSKLNVVYL